MRRFSSQAKIFTDCNNFEKEKVKNSFYKIVYANPKNNVKIPLESINSGDELNEKINEIVNIQVGNDDVLMYCGYSDK